MLTILFSLIALITPVDDDFPVLNVIGDSDTFSVRHIDYQQLKDEKKWGVIRKYMLMKKKGELFRDYLPRKIRESMISDTSYFAVKKGERGVPQKMVKVKQFKLREGFAVNKLLPGLKGKDNQKGHTIFKLLSNAKSGGVEVWYSP